MTRQHLFGGLALLGAVVLLSGCHAPKGVSVPPGSEDLAPCEVREIDVEHLAEIGEPDCDLAGSTLVFPDGTALPIQEVGAAFASSDTRTGLNEYQIVNWGVPGIEATIVRDGDLIEAWASSSGARELQHERLRMEGNP